MVSSKNGSKKPTRRKRTDAMPTDSGINDQRCLTVELRGGSLSRLSSQLCCLGSAEPKALARADFEGVRCLHHDQTDALSAWAAASSVGRLGCS
jgi:hypothetical protein